MRLSEWRASAPATEAAGPKVAAVVDPVLAALGAGPDPHCWIAWGEEPANRFTLFVPTDPGLVACFVRVQVAGEGPRATTKLVRWSKVTIGELAVETQGGHRMLSFQLESQVLRAVDAEADRAAAFALRVIAAIDGRPLPPEIETRGRKAGAVGRVGAAAGGGNPGLGKAPVAGARTASGARAPRPAKAGSPAASTSGGVPRPKASTNASR